MKIFYFGNPYLKEDSLAIKTAEKLKTIFPKIEFVYVKDSFQILSMKEQLDGSVILDVVKGLKHPQVISQDNIKKNPFFSSHDFDLGSIIGYFKLKTKIIGIPQEYPEEKAIEETAKILSLVLNEKTKI